MVDHHFSKTSSVLSGVPQGSVLGPLLFILFIDDITDLLPKPISAKLFADDLKLYSEISARTDPSMAFENIERWSELWQLKINKSKSSSLRLGKCPLDHDQNIVYFIAGHPLLQREGATDLGIEIDPNLKFSAHIENFTSRAFRCLGVSCKAFTRREFFSWSELIYNLCKTRPRILYPNWVTHID